ncbi:MAG: hypothetical protein RIC14_09965 [Filomicrobium sp.]
MRFRIIVAVVLLSSTTGFAGELSSFNGVAKGKSTRQAEPVAEGHVLLNLSTVYSSFETSDPKSPFKDQTGKCWGAIEVNPPNANGGGNCVFTTASGDKHFNKWTVTGLSKDGASVGNWVVIGGTGKYEGASGGGTFQALTDQKTGETSNTVEGAVILK